MPSTPSKTSSPAELLEQLKSQLATPLFTAISDQLTQFQNTVVAYENKLLILVRRPCEIGM